MHAKLEAILSGLGLDALLPAFLGHKIDDRLLAELNDHDLKEIGVEMIGDRKRLLMAFAPGSKMGFPVKAKAAPALTPAPQELPGGTRDKNPLLASQTQPFVNSLGMPFVPIPLGKTLFCVWQLRIRDYRQYCVESGAAMPEADFPQEPDHPVVNVRWHDARLFCEWLTKREAGMIPGSMIYRLPRDEEWSVAVGLPHESGATPKACSGVAEGYPWGGTFPPPPDAGNYHSRFGCGFHDTSPVGSFPPNKLGICDLGGNVWEWCIDQYEKSEDQRVVRGGSCFNDDPEFLMSSARNHFAPDHAQNNVGVRIVLTTSAGLDLWHRG